MLSGRHFTVFQALGRNGTLTFCSRSRGRSLQLLQPCSRALLEQYVDSDHCVLENPLEPAIHPLTRTIHYRSGHPSTAVSSTQIEPLCPEWSRSFPF